MTQKTSPKTQSFLLQCWEDYNETLDVSLWRYSLENPQTHQRQGCANLTELIIALQRELLPDRSSIADGEY